MRDEPPSFPRPTNLEVSIPAMGSMGRYDSEEVETLIKSDPVLEEYLDQFE